MGQLRTATGFMQVDSGLARSRGGLGLGPALVRSLVELHHGRITAHSAGLNQSSEFVMRLPLGDRHRLRQA
jgi:signal transduction histidine kinase